MPLFENNPQVANVVGIVAGNRLQKPLQQCFAEVKNSSWGALTECFIHTPQGQKLAQFVDAQVHAGEIIYPATPFLALTLTPLEKISVVILGQDPYHGPMQAQGLAFSVSEGVKVPPSLRNMFKELQRDLNVPLAASGSLVRWAKQGVLLLNATLTVKDGHAASHAKKGWEVLTDDLIKTVALKTDPVVFMLWGGHAQAKEVLITQAMQQTGTQHLILKANHPSPLSALRPPVPFIGCGHFSAANSFLKGLKRELIVW